jgi:hypothetical protein
MADRIYVTLVPRYPRKGVFRMVSGSPLLRPRDADALRAELRRVADLDVLAQVALGCTNPKRRNVFR